MVNTCVSFFDLDLGRRTYDSPGSEMFKISGPVLEHGISRPIIPCVFDTES